MGALLPNVLGPVKSAAPQLVSSVFAASYQMPLIDLIEGFTSTRLAQPPQRSASAKIRMSKDLNAYELEPGLAAANC